MESNHWFIAEKTKVGVHFHTWDWAIREGQLDEEGIDHLCGQGCCHRVLDGYLSEMVEKPEVLCGTPV
jgi:hypothetical protein